MIESYIRIGLMSPIMGRANLKPFSNLIKLIKPVSDTLNVIKIYDKSLENYVDENDVLHEKQDNLIKQILYYVYTQLKISHNLYSLSSDVDIWIFYLGHKMLIPMITCKMLRKKVILVMGSSPKDNMMDFPLISHLIIKINLFLIDRLVIYSPRLLLNWNIEKYQDKVQIARHHFLNCDQLKIEKKASQRDNIVGYVGRLSQEKGFHNFIKAILNLQEQNINFIICGDGDLMDFMKDYFETNNVKNVQIKGWVPNVELTSYMKDFKIIVIPSYTEGLPNTLLEAMASGTPVLATRVGAIPDIIVDGENGFLMEDNSPETIATNIIRVLNYHEIDEITNNAFNTVKNSFSYSKTSKDWELIVNSYKDIRK